MTIVTRPALFLAATVFAAAFAPADAPSTTGPSGAPASAAGAACPKGGLSTLVPDTLTVGTDQPVYQPWYVDDAPENGAGLRERGRLRRRRPARLPEGQGRLDPRAVQRGNLARPEVLRPDLTEFSITDERKQAVDFSAPYYDVKQAVVTLLGQCVRGHHERRRASRVARLGAQVGTTSYDAINDVIKPNTPAAVFNTNDDAKLALSNGQVDAIVVDLPTAFFITSAELQNGARSSASCRPGRARRSSSVPCWTRAAR